MYEDHYQVFDDPFRFTPDEHNPYQHHSYLSGVAFLQHVLDHSRKVLILIYGVSGVGKSTLVNDILRRQDADRVQPVTFKASSVNSHGVIQSVCRAFSLNEEGSEDVLIEQLNDYLTEKSTQNLYSLFVIEDAHELSAESLNRLGQLVRLIWDKRYKMKIFLIGSPILDQLLYHSKNEILQKKIIIGWNQHGMGENEIGQYVAHRIHNVGGTKLAFEDIVWRTLYDFSDGIPRRINRICNKLLLNGFIDKKLSFTNADIMDAVRQLDNEGLLEVKKSFATLHGLKGTSNDYKDDGHELEVSKFTEGFAEPLLVEKFLVIDNEYDSSTTPPIVETTKEADETTIKQPVKEQKIPDLNVKLSFEPDSHHDLLEDDKPGLLTKWPVIITILLLGLAGAYLYFDPSIMDKDTGQPVDIPKVAMDSETSTVDEPKPIQADNVKPDDSLIAASTPLAPEPKAASDTGTISETAMSDVTDKKEIPTADAEGIISTDTSVQDDVDVDETGEVEERARIAQEKALAASAKKISKTVQKEVTGQQHSPVEVVPRFTINQLKKMLLAGSWKRSGQAAVLLPSELNTCTENSKDIFCRATETQTLADNKTITSRTGAMFHQFSGEGAFNMSYRRSASIESGKVSSPNDLREYQMSCHFVNSKQVDCIKDGVLVRFVR